MKIKCPVCDGTGNRFSRDEDDMKCHTCGGTGYVEDGKTPNSMEEVFAGLYNNFKYINHPVCINVSRDRLGNQSVTIVTQDANDKTVSWKLKGNVAENI